MQTRSINAADAPAPAGNYSQALEVTGASRTLYLSGQIPADRAGTVPPDFTSQARQCWTNIAAQLEAAGMSLDHLVVVRIYLSDRRYAMENRAVRQEVLGDRAPALTVIVADIFDAAWLLEIEAVACA
jgi:enamine deaminase RidA (YjgF/YER057c/UK114 family)